MKILTTNGASEHAGAREAAFTMLDLLGALAAMILLLVVLLPARAQTQDLSKRLGCLNNIKHWTAALLMNADDNDQTLPRAQGTSPHWMKQAGFRNTFNKTYGIPRPEFYCPANPGWNRDDFWNWSNGGQDTVMGYAYFAGESNYFGPSHTRYVPSNRQAFALKTTDLPFYTVLFGDSFRKSTLTWDRSFNDPGHFAGNAPAGGNYGYLDGRAEWVPAPIWVSRPKLLVGSQYYMHGGKENP